MQAEEYRAQVKDKLYELWDNWRFHKFFSRGKDTMLWITEAEQEITTDTELTHRIMIQWCIDRNHLM